MPSVINFCKISSRLWFLLNFTTCCEYPNQTIEKFHEITLKCRFYFDCIQFILILFRLHYIIQILFWLQYILNWNVKIMWLKLDLGKFVQFKSIIRCKNCGKRTRCICVWHMMAECDTCVLIWVKLLFCGQNMK